MNSNASDDSSTLDAIRKTAISRRGGVRVRGGRLPPVRLRDVMPTSTKKVISPKIPQRRIKTEKKSPEPVVAATTSYIKDERKDSRKPFSRGRGQRVYIQTEGSFLEQGPALRLKKETFEPRYERISRASSRMKNEIGSKINLSQINLLLEGYDEEETYSDYENDMQPVRFPSIKVESKAKIKEEKLDSENMEVKIKKEILDNEYIKLEIKEEILSNEDVKPNIKEEILDNEDLSVKIKKEPEDEANETKVNLILPELKTEKQEIPEAKICSLMEAVTLSQEEDVFVLFQLPSCLPFPGFDASSNQMIKKEGTLENSSEPDGRIENSQDEMQLHSYTRTSFNDMPEGAVGKLQLMKSGRMRWTLGSVDIAIESSVHEGSTAEIVSISNTDKDEGHLIVLGKIYQKMIMYPIFTDPQKEIKSEKGNE